MLFLVCCICNREYDYDDIICFICDRIYCCKCWLLKENRKIEWGTCYCFCDNECKRKYMIYKDEQKNLCQN